METNVTDPFPAAPPTNGPRLRPTDLAQFVRLDQCERYLRLRLHERGVNANFMHQYGVEPTAIPPLLTRSGTTFEQTVMASINRCYETTNLAAASADSGNRPEDNAAVLDAIRDLANGGVRILYQPRLDVELAGWRVRGDIDVLRLERDSETRLHVLIADMKSSTSAKVEHRLQVAFYAEMLATLLEEAGIACDDFTLAILYRGPADNLDAATEATQRAQSEAVFGVTDALLEIVTDGMDYRRSIRELVTDPDATARRIMAAPFDDVPFHLNDKCDGCIYNEFCLKRSAERDDLSLIPYLTPQEKGALLRGGITTVKELATLREPLDGDVKHLVATLGKEELNGALAATWPVGPRLDELVHRARRYRRSKGDAIGDLSYIPSKGYGSLPYSDATQNPNLVRVYIDAQQDYLEDRVWLLGARVVASEAGVERPERMRTIVHIADGPPDSLEKEESLFIPWVNAVLRAVVELAAPDADGAPRAPIHLVFYDRQEQRLLLEGLARHAGTVFGATPLYDFATQLAAFDSPVVTYLSEEIRELKNYPVLCQSLQAIAALAGFDWDGGVEPYRRLFRARLFDSQGRLRTGSGEPEWHTRRARFGSQIPLEYAYAAWGEIPEARAGREDESAPYRYVTVAQLIGFQQRRLEAMEKVAKEFPGNKQTEKRAFDLPDLAMFDDSARTLAAALDEFVTVERFVELGAWKNARLAPPERRLLSGITLLGQYDPAHQEPGVASINGENRRKHDLAEQYRRDLKATDPGVAGLRLTKEQRDETKWAQEGLRVRLDLATDGIDCTLDEALALTTLRVGDGVVVQPRWTVDGRLPPDQQTPFTPTPRQMLYGTRATIVEMHPHGRYVVIAVRGPRGGTSARGFTFAAIDQPFRDGMCYSLDADPNDWYGSFCAKVTEALCQGESNTLYQRLDNPGQALVAWPAEAAEGQARFLAGLDALHAAGALHPFEQAKRDFIGGHGDAPVLLVQGPPGTGKSYSTAFALYARMQGALVAGVPFRAFASCKTHAATNVLLGDIAMVRAMLAGFRESHPAVFAEYFDCRLLDVPLYRMAPSAPLPEGVIALPRDADREKGTPRAVEQILAAPYGIVAATPGGVYRMTQDKWGGKALLGHEVADCLVLDEASQMNLPEACMAALLLKREGQLVVVGDHRQMPPIIKHDWEMEPRRTFAQYRVYESLFNFLRGLDPPTIKFSESFRLHADMAEFLRREIYVKDDIPYFSHNRGILVPHATGDPFVDAVLTAEHSLIVVIHEEDRSQHRNVFEQALITPVLEALAVAPYSLDPERGLGVVVPHRAQRAALREGIPALTRLDADGNVDISAVDTVERFQGGEREAIVVSATESDREYLLVSGDFLLDPRRLTVALSRARKKMVLVASRSVFTILSADEETFANAQLWKNLRYRTCTVPLWQGKHDGIAVSVWGNNYNSASMVGISAGAIPAYCNPG